MPAGCPVDRRRRSPVQVPSSWPAPINLSSASSRQRRRRLAQQAAAAAARGDMFISRGGQDVCREETCGSSASFSSCTFALSTPPGAARSRWLPLVSRREASLATVGQQQLQPARYRRAGHFVTTLTGRARRMESRPGRQSSSEPFTAVVRFIHSFICRSRRAK